VVRVSRIPRVVCWHSHVVRVTWIRTIHVRVTLKKVKAMLLNQNYYVILSLFQFIYEASYVNVLQLLMDAGYTIFMNMSLHKS
jgi:hypothetical protein